MIENYILRFAIPFHLNNYRSLKKENFKSLSLSGWKEESIVYGEKDLYTYVLDLVSKEGENQIGSSWMLKKDNCFQKKYVVKIENKSIYWCFKQVGLILFDTEIGILWYQIENKGEFEDLGELQKFLHEVKELSRGKKGKIYECVSVLKKDYDNNQTMENSYNIQTKNGIIVKGEIKVCFFEEILKHFLGEIKVDTFFVDRVFEKEKVYPDKAISFLWVLDKPHEIQQSEIEECAFRLGRCYTESYSMDKGNEGSKFFKPFDDSIWYVSLEGCANYIVPSKEKKFYLQGYKGKLCNYFYLFLLCIGQYYALILLTQKSIDLSLIEKKEIHRSNYLEKLLYTMRIFSIKMNYSQVGSITQYNEFYKYVRVQLNIEQMNKEQERNLQWLYEMNEQKRAVQKVKMYKCFSIISGLFVIVELFCNLLQNSSVLLGNPYKNIDKIYRSILGVVIIVTVGVAIFGINNLFIKRKIFLNKLIEKMDRIGNKLQKFYMSYTNKFRD